jgi:peroxiredoxin-like protein
MEEERHFFDVNSVWVGDSDGDGKLIADNREMEYGRPASLGGKPGRTNPEELLVESVLACYSITFAILVEKKRLPVSHFEVSAQGEIVRQPDRSLKYTAIHIKPKITLDSTDEAMAKSALDAAHRTDKYCLISNALKGNVEITVAPEIVK